MEASFLNIDEELQNHIAELTEAQKKSILDMIKSFRKEDSMMREPQTIEEYNKELAEAEQKIEAGEFYTQDEVKQMMNKLFK